MSRILLLAVALVFAGCTSPDQTRRVLESHGYTDIEITGYRMWSCSEDDDWKTGFRATSPAGHPVSGTVCSGLLKGATIRLDARPLRGQPDVPAIPVPPVIGDTSRATPTDRSEPS